MANDVPVDVLVAAYTTEQGAKDALHELDDARKANLIRIRDAAVLMRDADNKLHITETTDKGFGRGAVIGGIGGAVVGLIAGPIGWATVGGAAIGGLAAKLRDGGFRDDRLRQVGEGLKPGSSALIAVIEHEWVKQVEDMLREEAETLVTETLEAAIARQLEEQAAQQPPQAVEGQQGGEEMKKAA
ncbi:MAG TPA: DUF1269 domain-containing protein [Dehalococcoidia bacterium]|jgi:uncharacterized membrane protein